MFEWLCPLYAVYAGRRAVLGPAGRGRDAAQRHHHLPRGRHHPLPRRGGRRARRDRHPRPCRGVGVGPATRARRVPAATDEAIAQLEDQLVRHRRRRRSHGAWSILVGHTTCSDPLWRARQSSPTSTTRHDLPHVAGPVGPRRLHRRVRPAPDDPPRRDRRARRQRGITHCVHIDDAELAAMRHRVSSVAHCPTTALKVSYGVTQVGKMPEMVQQGINVSIGTDGNNASNYSDLMRATYLVAGLFKDARIDPQMFPAEKAYEMATLGRAALHGVHDQIGSTRSRQEGRPRAARHRPTRVAPAAQRDEPARVVGRRAGRAHRGGRRPHRGRAATRPRSTKPPCGRGATRGEAIVGRSACPTAPSFRLVSETGGGTARHES